jgi:rRNA biogenesis protein RRP5
MPDLRKMFKVGQLVRCIIVELTDVTDDAAAKKRIDLSMKPHLVNANLDTQTLFAGMTLQTAVQSCEDHGYVIDTGIKGITAFLPKKDTRGAELVAGQPIECSIVKPPTAQRRAMTLTVDPMAAQKPITSKNLLLSTLQPGMLVNARVQRASSQGVWVKFLDFFEGTIDWLHASRIAEGEAPAQDLAQSFSEGQKVRIPLVDDLLIF